MLAFLGFALSCTSPEPQPEPAAPVPPSCASGPSLVDAGLVPDGERVAFTVTLTNTCLAPYEIADIEVTGGWELTPLSTFTIAPGDTLDLVLSVVGGAVEPTGQLVVHGGDLDVRVRLRAGTARGALWIAPLVGGDPVPYGCAVELPFLVANLGDAEVAATLSVLGALAEETVVLAPGASTRVTFDITPDWPGRLEPTLVVTRDEVIVDTWEGVIDVLPEEVRSTIVTVDLDAVDVVIAADLASDWTGPVSAAIEGLTDGLDGGAAPWRAAVVAVPTAGKRTTTAWTSAADDLAAGVVAAARTSSDGELFWGLLAWSDAYLTPTRPEGRRPVFVVVTDRDQIAWLWGQRIDDYLAVRLGIEPVFHALAVRTATSGCDASPARDVAAVVDDTGGRFRALCGDPEVEWRAIAAQIADDAARIEIPGHAVPGSILATDPREEHVPMRVSEDGHAVILDAPVANGTDLTLRWSEVPEVCP